MRAVRITKRDSKRRSNDWNETGSASFLRNDKQCIGAHADYRREDFIFPRTQSLAMRALEWESRLKPIRPRMLNLVANVVCDIFA